MSVSFNCNWKSPSVSREIVYDYNNVLQAIFSLRSDMANQINMDLLKRSFSSLLRLSRHMSFRFGEVTGFTER
jgi:hypothetical protein